MTQYATPLQAAKEGIVQRLCIVYPSLSKSEIIEKSGLSEYVPVAVDELVVEGKIEYINGRYVLKGTK